MKYETSVHHSAAAEERDLTPKLFVLSTTTIRLPDTPGRRSEILGVQQGLAGNPHPTAQVPPLEVKKVNIKQHRSELAPSKRYAWENSGKPQPSPGQTAPCVCTAFSLTGRDPQVRQAGPLACKRGLRIPKPPIRLTPF